MLLVSYIENHCQDLWQGALPSPHHHHVFFWEFHGFRFYNFLVKVLGVVPFFHMWIANFPSTIIEKSFLHWVFLPPMSNIWVICLGIFLGSRFYPTDLSVFIAVLYHFDYCSFIYRTAWNHKVCCFVLLSQDCFGLLWFHIGASLVAQMVKNLPAVQDNQVKSLGREDPLEKRMATH